MSKVMTMKEAIAEHVSDGDFLFIGGYICRTPFAAIHEIIRQGKKELTITRSNAADDFDMMIGAGVVRRFVATFLSLGYFGLGRCYRRSIEEGVPHKIELEEYTNLSLPMMLMAGAMGMPFVPVKDMVGSDLLNVQSFMGENKYKMIDSPFDGSRTMLVPALHPDVAIIHVQQADEDGNAQIWGIGGDCQAGANAARKVIVSCERIVSRDVIGKDPSRTIVPDFKVVAVVEEPFGAHPGYTPGFYDVDFRFGSRIPAGLQHRRGLPGIPRRVGVRRARQDGVHPALHPEIRVLRSSAHCRQSSTTGSPSATRIEAED